MGTSVLFSLIYYVFCYISFSPRSTPAGVICKPYSISYKSPGLTVRTATVRGARRITHNRPKENKWGRQILI